MTNPTTLTWTDPTTNVDGSPITAGEITGYQIGVRPSVGVAGTYPFTAKVENAAATSGLLSSLNTILAPGTYFAAVQTLTANSPSAWTPEVSFTIVAAVPNPPSGLKIA